MIIFKNLKKFIIFAPTSSISHSPCDEYENLCQMKNQTDGISLSQVLIIESSEIL